MAVVPRPTMLWQDAFSVRTTARAFSDLTSRVEAIVQACAFSMGTAHVFVHHTSCSLIITENADPAVRRDLNRYMARLVQDGDPLFEHADEGADDMSAHIRSVLTASAVNVPITRGRLALGTWQGIYLWEHRGHAHDRRVTVTLTGA